MTDLSWFEDHGTYEGYDLSSLSMDAAYLTINADKQYGIFKKHVDCYKCAFVPLQEQENLLVPTTRITLRQTPNLLYRISESVNDILQPSDDYICEFGTEFGEFGVYEINVTEAKKCNVQILKNAVSTSFPVLTVFLIYCALFLLIFGTIFLWKYTTKTFQEPKNEKDKTEAKVRVKSLDTFRGISIVIMIFVNFGAGSYSVLEHATWNGLHLADLVFPWFLWIMGACIPISLMSSFKKQLSNKSIFLNVLKRAIKLFCLGIFLGSGTALKCLRIFGVLQRFGICYLVVTTICLFLMKRDLTTSTHKVGKFFTDLIVTLRGWIVVLLIFFIHCLITFLVAEDGCPKGYLGPGGLHDDGKYFNCTGGATGYIDRVILGKHLYQYPTSKEIFLGEQAFDPEGILGNLTSIVHVFIGVQAGVILLTYKSHQDRLIRWLCWSVLTGIVGGALCGFGKEEGAIPVNKNLWSISFVLVTCCFAFFLLSVCYVLVDVKSIWSGKPFLFAGMNAILLYTGHEMTGGNFPVRWNVSCDEGHSTHFIALFENLWGTMFWVSVSYYWYKIGYFYTI